ncbi:hypothetical protein F5887DRAFT_921032 [Amanita rubescens]|nr:hypothetical protein F5887DRAFT_921032 [Amanita rubescens]
MSTNCFQKPLLLQSRSSMALCMICRNDKQEDKELGTQAASTSTVAMFRKEEKQSSCLSKGRMVHNVRKILLPDEAGGIRWAKLRVAWERRGGDNDGDKEVGQSLIYGQVANQKSSPEPSHCPDSPGMNISSKNNGSLEAMFSEDWSEITTWVDQMHQDHGVNFLVVAHGDLSNGKDDLIYLHATQELHDPEFLESVKALIFKGRSKNSRTQASGDVEDSVTMSDETDEKELEMVIVGEEAEKYGDTDGKVLKNLKNLLVQSGEVVQFEVLDTRGRLKWWTMVNDMVDQGVYLDNYPYILMPQEKRHERNQGIQNLSRTEQRTLIEALRSEANQCQFIRLPKQNQNDIKTCKHPLIVFAPPSPEDQHKRGKRYFCNGKIDWEGHPPTLAANEDSGGDGSIEVEHMMTMVKPLPPFHSQALAKKRPRLRRSDGDSESSLTESELGSIERPTIKGLQPAVCKPSTRSRAEHNSTAPAREDLAEGDNYKEGREPKAPTSRSNVKLAGKLTSETSENNFGEKSEKFTQSRRSRHGGLRTMRKPLNRPDPAPLTSKRRRDQSEPTDSSRSEKSKAPKELAFKPSVSGQSSEPETKQRSQRLEHGRSTEKGKHSDHNPARPSPPQQIYDYYHYDMVEERNGCSEGCCPPAQCAAGPSRPNYAFPPNWHFERPSNMQAAPQEHGAMHYNSFHPQGYNMEDHDGPPYGPYHWVPRNDSHGQYYQGDPRQQPRPRRDAAAEDERIQMQTHGHY